MTAVAQGQPTASGWMKKHTARGGGGLRLHVREWGKADGPRILFIHGWSQNHLCWVKQYESALADEFRLVAYDLRGHGMSEAPLEPEHYTDATLWADDVAAIVGQLELDRPVLVGWSYGSYVICDYVRLHGQDRIAAINFVEGAVKLGESSFRHADRPRLRRPLRRRHCGRPAAPAPRAVPRTIRRRPRTRPETRRLLRISGVSSHRPPRSARRLAPAPA
jgi:pimeloyl-ACP methyl ester carboxylesterase